MLFTEITDDLTGAADSGSYFTARGQILRICTSGQTDISRKKDELLSVNLSSRNTSKEYARESHFELCRKLPDVPDQVFMKKIGTGFRGNDAYELEGLLQAKTDYMVFIIDNAPDLGTFTLYGNQYCEGQILHKSVYAKDPIFPPKESYIPAILAHDTKIPIGLVNIDSVKGDTLLLDTSRQVEAGARILIFDAITREDTLRIISTLYPHYPKVFWTGSLGLADGLAQYLYGDVRPADTSVRPLRCLGFCASAYEIARRQVEYSEALGLHVVRLDMDAYIDGDPQVLRRAAQEAADAVKSANVLLMPAVKKYSYQSGTSRRIMQCFHELAALVCPKARFDRLVMVGGETSQAVFSALDVRHLSLGQQLETGVAQGKIEDGLLAGREFSLKGGSMGGLHVLEKMMCCFKEEIK